MNPPVAADTKLTLSWPLAPVGTESDNSLIIGTTDQVTLRLVLEPPVSFLSGEMRIALAIIDKSVRPRQRRFVISKFIHAAKTKITADIINKTD
jgi:hypothetical protein